MKVYDPKEVTLTVFGRNITGFGSGGISIDPSGPLVTHNMGFTGDIAYTKSADRTATLTFTLQQNSADNAFLHGVINAADLGKEWPTGVCKLHDPTSPTLPTMDGCTILERPNRSNGADQQDVTWKVFVTKYNEIPQQVIGGEIITAVVEAATAIDSFKKLRDLFK